MKKQFEIPTIEKINFKLSDSDMCVKTSGATTDYGVIGEMTKSQSGNVMGK